jgi:Amidohydrolase
VPIYLHPTIPHPDVLKSYFEGYEDLATPAWGFAMDTCTHFLRLVFAGLFDAYPNLKMILGHLGERFAVLDSSPERPHSIRRQTAGFEEDPGAISEREPRGHNERQLLHARFPMYLDGARCG